MLENKNASLDRERLEAILREGGENPLGCCFTGHRIISSDDLERTRLVLRRCIRIVSNTCRIRRFYAGGALGFDTLAAEAVLLLRDEGLPIELHLLLPCRDQAARWSARDRAVYEQILARADSIEYISENYTRGCMHARNRALVDGSDLCLAYLTANRGGTLYTCSYALKNGVRLINVAEEMS